MLKNIWSAFNKNTEEKPTKMPTGASCCYHIDPDKCRGCGACKKVCKANAASGEHRKPYIIDEKKCIQCGTCMKWCRFKAINKSELRSTIL